MTVRKANLDFSQIGIRMRVSYLGFYPKTDPVLKGSDFPSELFAFYASIITQIVAVEFD